MNEQDRLLEYTLRKNHLSPEVIAAYRKAPRHLFIKRNYTMEEMYQDHPLELYRDSQYISTISQPSFVLLMLEMLDLRPGQKVLEVGAGSGWNAALMGHLVGKEGKIVSLEIIPSLAQETKENLSKLGYSNVEIIEGDAALGYPAEAPYDRGIFTAGATDLPEAFHEQIKVGGKLLFVLQTRNVDLLLLLDKKEDHFEEISRLPCSFVPLKGIKAHQRWDEWSPVLWEEGPISIYPRTSGEGSDSMFSVT